MTTKLQVTLPKALAERYRVRPGDEIDWEAAGDVIRVVPHGKQRPTDRALRLRLFDAATARQRRRKRRLAPGSRGRGWSREELYDRGRAR